MQLVLITYSINIDTQMLTATGRICDQNTSKTFKLHLTIQNELKRSDIKFQFPSQREEQTLNWVDCTNRRPRIQNYVYRDIISCFSH